MATLITPSGPTCKNQLIYEDCSSQSCLPSSLTKSRYPTQSSRSPKPLGLETFNAALIPVEAISIRLLILFVVVHHYWCRCPATAMSTPQSQHCKPETRLRLTPDHLSKSAALAVFPGQALTRVLGSGRLLIYLLDCKCLSSNGACFDSSGVSITDNEWYATSMLIHSNLLIVAANRPSLYSVNTKHFGSHCLLHIANP